MVQRKDIRSRGKLQLSKFFQKFEEGDIVSVIRNVSLKTHFPKKLQGKTGIVEGARGKFYLVRIKDNAKEKRYLIEPIHLKKWVAKK